MAENASNAKKINNNGLLLTGLVMGKNIYNTSKGDKHSLDVACPGSGLRSMVSICVDEASFMSHEVMDQITTKIDFSLFNGKVYFNQVV